MALIFPSASVGQTYQSGSSSTYKWNGTYWAITAIPPTLVATVTSASYAPQRKDVSWISTAGADGGLLFIAEGKLYGIKGNNAGSVAYSNAPGVLVSGSVSSNYNVGIKYAYQIDFPNEISSSIVSASSVLTTGLALFNNGNLYGWGYNSSGELGLGVTNVPIYEPALIATNVSDFYRDQSIASTRIEYQRILIKKTDGYVYGAGYNGNGNLGLGSATASYINTFVRLDGIGQNPMFVANIGSNVGGVIAQKADTTVVGCGYNNNGWLGLSGSTAQQNSFVTLSGWLGGDSSMRIKKVFSNTEYFDGAWQTGLGCMNMWVSSSTGNGQKVMFAGNGYFGTSGNGRAGNINYLTVMSASLPTASAFIDVVWTGSPKAIYAWTGSSVYSWGKNDYGQLGYSTYDTTPNAWPSASLAVTGVVDILHKDYTTYLYGQYNQSPVFKLTDSNYYMCGFGDAGQLGIGEIVGGSRVPSLQKIRLPLSESLKYVSSLGVTNQYSTYFGVTPDNRVYAWGTNSGYNTIDAYSAYHFLSPVIKTPQVLFK